MNSREEPQNNRMQLTAPRVGRAVYEGVVAAAACAFAHRRRS
jgi:hypothetical protein